ncbi:MAG: hopanoid biosynthesis-associated protein HpnK [Rhodospirillales bacterium]
MGPGEYGLKRLIVTADDYGASLPVNEAIETAHRDGILTAACLMVGAPMAEDAVKRTRRLPNLRVGLHLVVVRGRPVLAPERIPDLVDGDGRFDGNLVRAGFRYFFLPRVRRQLAAEIRAQFEAFQATGLALDHANAHNHMHLHPTVLRLIVDIGREFGLAAVRLPHEPGGGIFLAPWIALMKRRLRRNGLRFNDFIFGIRDTGRMDSDALRRTIAALPDGVSEIFLHPATGRWAEMESEAAGFRFEDEFKALVDPAVRAAVAEAGAELIAFGDLINQP